MKRKFLAVGLAAAAVVSITCGYMTTAMAAGPVNQTEDEVACDLLDIMESIEDEALRESPAAEITAFAAEIQDTVSGRDLEALAELCDFPISVTMQDGTSLTVNSREDFITLGKESVFTRSLVHEIGIADPAGQQIYGNGIVMGNRNNIIINRMHGSLAVTGFNFNSRTLRHTCFRDSKKRRSDGSPPASTYLLFYFASEPHYNEISLPALALLSLME